jgi:hypothetical protein
VKKCRARVQYARSLINGPRTLRHSREGGNPVRARGGCGVACVFWILTFAGMTPFWHSFTSVEDNRRGLRSTRDSSSPHDSAARSAILIPNILLSCPVDKSIPSVRADSQDLNAKTPRRQEPPPFFATSRRCVMLFGCGYAALWTPLRRVTPIAWAYTRGRFPTRGRCNVFQTGRNRRSPHLDMPR